VSGNTDRNHLTEITLDEASIGRGSPDIEHERAIAIYDLIEENHFNPVDDERGPYKLRLSIVESRLVFDIATATDTGTDEPVATHILSLTPFRKVIKDYFLICESYYEAIKTASPSQIEAIDMGRRGLHNEGSTVLMDRLGGKIALDLDTARRLFTLICVLHWKG